MERYTGVFVENREQNRIEPSRKWSDFRVLCVATGTRRMGRKGTSLVELTEKKKPTENSRLWGIGGVQVTTEQLAVGANEHWSGLLRECAHEPSITRATSPWHSAHLPTSSKLPPLMVPVKLVIVTS